MEQLRAKIAARKGNASASAAPANRAATATTATTATSSTALAARVKAAKLLAARRAQQAKAAGTARPSATTSGNNLTTQQRIEALKAQRIAALREKALRQRLAAKAKPLAPTEFTTPRSSGSVSLLCACLQNVVARGRACVTLTSGVGVVYEEQRSVCVTKQRV